MNTGRFVLICLALLCCTMANAQLTANLSANQTQGCSPFLVQFNDLSTGGATSWDWDFGNSNTSTQQNPFASYINPGTYTVTLIVGDGTTFDTLTLVDYITVFANPTANFSSTGATSGCAPITVNFNDLSTMGDTTITNWLWDFGDGNFSTQQNPQHTYTSPGSFPVSLQITDGNGCSSTIVIPNYVNVSGQPNPSFSAAPTTACAPPLTVNFTNTSTGSGTLTYIWDFGDGSPTSTQANPTHTYTNLGQFTIILIVIDQNGCSDTLTQLNSISVQDPTAAFSVLDTVCPGANVQFNNTSTGGTSWNWDFGDFTGTSGQNPTHTYNTPGTYTVTLITSAGPCSDTITHDVVVENVVIDFDIVPPYSCDVPVTVQFNDLSPNGATWQWNFDDPNGVCDPNNTSSAQNPVHTYCQEGDYIVTLNMTTTNGCGAQVSDTVHIHIMQPAFLADTTRGCDPLTVNFTDQSTPVDTVISWLWDFGDGSPTTTVQNPTHTFTPDSQYTVCLTVSNGICDTTACTIIEVGTPPIADFTWDPDTSCAFDFVQFTDLSTDSTLIDEWIWTFGDGGGANVPDPPHQHVDTGWMQTTLIVGYNGCYDTLTIDSTVYILGPVSGISVVMNCDSPFVWGFSTNPIDYHRFYWDFDDGSPLDSVNLSPIHTYANTGDYLVNLITYNDSTGCYWEEDYLVQVRDIKAAFTMSTSKGCRPLSVTFDAGPSQDEFQQNNGCQFGQYLWDFGDGTVYPNGCLDTLTYDTLATHVFDPNGVYDVQLVVVDVNGCRDTARNKVRVYQPAADLTSDVQTGCVPFPVNFADMSTGDTTLVSWDWDFGNLQTSNLQNPTSIYSLVGTYDVSLMVTDAMGCKDSITYPAYITTSNPIPNFIAISLINICVGESVNFLNLSQGNGLTYLWDFGDGNFSSQQNPSHTFQDTGRFTISLTITDANGCDSTKIRLDYIHVQPNPIAGFTSDTLQSNCYPLLVQFLDTSISNYLASWQWYFGDLTAGSVVQNPVHNYTQPGVYDVTLVVTTTYGCTDSITIPQYIQVDGPYAEFTMFPDTICVGEAVTFQMVNDTNVFNVQWDFGDGNTGTGATVLHVYEQIGNIYPVLLYSDSAQTCPKFAIDTLFVYEVAAGFFLDDTAGCAPFQFQFTDTSVNATGWGWDFAGGDTSQVIDSLIMMNGAGTYTVGQFVSDTVFQCKDTAWQTVVVHPLPYVDANADSLVCWGDSVQLLATSPDPVSYQWTPSTGLTNDTITNPVAGPDQTTTYVIQVTDTNGCQSDSFTTVYVQQVPVITLNQDTAVIIGEQVNINAYGGPGVSYSWSPANGLSCTNCPNPIANPLETTTYTVTVVDSNGCFIVEATFTIEIIEDYTIDVPTAFSPNGDGSNDIIYVKGWGIKELEYWKIYNRWGELVFETNDINQGWNGYFKGELQNIETYVYVVKATMYNDDSFDKKGYISLLR